MFEKLPVYVYLAIYVSQNWSNNISEERYA